MPEQLTAREVGSRFMLACSILPSHEIRVVQLRSTHGHQMKYLVSGITIDHF